MCQDAQRYLKVVSGCACGSEDRCWVLFRVFMVGFVVWAFPCHLSAWCHLHLFPLGHVPFSVPA